MEDDESRDEAIASNPFRRPNFKSSGITPEQLAKFRELQKRRLQIKTKSKNKRKSKGSLDGTVCNVKGMPNENANKRLDEPSENSSSKSNEIPTSSPQVEVHPALKKKKLYWGLDTKERWERKANM